MACVIQFPHPGREPRLWPPAKPWSPSTQPHARAFLEARGAALESPDATETVQDQLRLWGEWEADASVSVVRASAREFFVERPVLQPRASFGGLHNTDPWVFDGPFLYSNCRQRGVLLQLDRGSLLIFGSTVNGKFLLDTVFVVARRLLTYRVRDAVTQLGTITPRSFVHAVAQPIQAAARNSGGEGCITDDDPGCISDDPYVLYEGATPTTRSMACSRSRPR